MLFVSLYPSLYIIRVGLSASIKGCVLGHLSVLGELWVFFFCSVFCFLNFIFTVGGFVGKLLYYCLFVTLNTSLEEIFIP
jgi:hypothetical protein